jgi:hypothetical protein
MIATLLSAAALCASPPTAVHRAAESLPVPHAAISLRIADELEINQLATRAEQLTVPAPFASVVEFYRSALGARRVESASSRGLLLAAPWQGEFLTVQLHAITTEQTTARVVVSALSDGKVSHARPPLVWPATSQLLSHTASRDACMRGEVWVLRNRLSVAANVDYFLRRFAEQGYRLGERRRTTVGSTSGEILSLSSAHRAATLVVADSEEQRWITLTTEERG